MLIENIDSTKNFTPLEDIGFISADSSPQIPPPLKKQPLQDQHPGHSNTQETPINNSASPSSLSPTSSLARNDGPQLPNTQIIVRSGESDISPGTLLNRNMNDNAPQIMSSTQKLEEHNQSIDPLSFQEQNSNQEDCFSPKQECDSIPNSDSRGGLLKPNIGFLGQGCLTYRERERRLMGYASSSDTTPKPNEYKNKDAVIKLHF